MRWLDVLVLCEAMEDWMMSLSDTNLSPEQFKTGLREAL